MNQNKQKIAFILALTLLLSMMPMSVFATDNVYNLSVDTELSDTTDGRIEIYTKQVTAGSIVTFAAIPNQGCQLDVIEYVYELGGEQIVEEPYYAGTSGSGVELYYFVMPQADVKLIADFLSEREVNVYRVVIEESEIPGGKVTAKNLVVGEGKTEKMLITYGGKVHAEDTVEITASPAANMRVKSVRVVPFEPKGGESEVNVRRVSGTRTVFMFVMPKYPVEILVEFEPGPDYPDRDELNLGSDLIANPDIESPVIANTFDKVKFAEKDWIVLSNKNGQMLLLLDNPIEESMPYDDVEAYLSNMKASMGSIEQSMLCGMPVSSSYPDLTTDVNGRDTVTTYSQIRSNEAKPFLLSVQDIRNYFRYEDQIDKNEEYWLLSTADGGRAFVTADGTIATASETKSKKIRPAVLINTSNIVLIKATALNANYTYVKAEERPGVTWNLLLQDAAGLNNLDILGSYRDLNKQTVKQTNDVFVVTTGDGIANVLIETKDGHVVYYAARSSFIQGKNISTFGNAFRDNVDFYVIQRADDNKYSSKLYEIDLHQHEIGYKQASQGAVTTVSMACITADGTVCFIELENSWLTVTAPEYEATPYAYKYDGTPAAVKLEKGSEFYPSEPAVSYYVLTANDEYALTQPGDPFVGNGADAQGGAPREDGQYKAVIPLGDIDEVEIPFTIVTDVYTVKAICTNPFENHLTFFHNDDSPINNRVHSNTAITVTVYATPGSVVGGLTVSSIGGIFTSFAEEEGCQTDTAVYIFTMPAAHVMLEPWFRPHEHVWSDQWSSDAAHHWAECTAVNCTLPALQYHESKASQGAHQWTSWTSINADKHQRTCEICNYVETTTHAWSTYISDGAAHWNECTAEGCTAEAFYENHSWVLTTDGSYHWNTCSVCGFETEHLDHNFIEKAETQYLKSEKTCTLYAVYYKVCSDCGITNIDSQVFTSGALSHHAFETKWTTNDAQHWHECEDCHTKNAIAAHSYDKKVVDAIYLISEATCTQKAVYYKSCECGYVDKTTADTFEHGETTAHAFSTVWTSDSSFHWHVCDDCSTADAFEAHVTQQSVDSQYICEDPTCTLNAIYYESCSVCGFKLNTTFAAAGTALGHTTQPGVIYTDAATHWYLCSVCAVTFGAVEHSFAPATCTLPAICTACGITSGEALGHKYVYQHHNSSLAHGKPWHTAKCSVCGEDKLFNEQKTEFHQQGIAPTCTHGSICSICGLEYGSESQHKYGSYASNAATHWRICKNCGATESAFHTPIDVVTDAAVCNMPRCTQEGIYYQTCKICGRILETTFKALGVTAHDFTSYKALSNNPREGHIKVCAICGEPENGEGWYYYHDFVVTATMGSVLCTGPSGQYIATTGHSLRCTFCGYTVENEQHKASELNVANCKHTAICDECGEHFDNLDEEQHTRSSYKDITTTSHSYTLNCGHGNEELITNNHVWISDRDLRLYSPNYFSPAALGTCTQPTIYYNRCKYCDYSGPGAPTFSALRFEDESLTPHAFCGSGPAAVLKTPATCVSPAEFYCVCECCGTPSTIYSAYDESSGEWIDVDEYGIEIQTFTSGDALGHDWGSPITNGAIDGISPDYEQYHYYICSRCGIITEAAHVLDQKTTSGTLISEATCTQYAVYGTYCTCGTFSRNENDTFTDGALKPHEADETKYYYNESQHWYLCKNCGSETEYLNITNHAFNIETVAPEYLKSDENCTQQAIYYTHCICGATGSATFTTGASTGHEAGTIYYHDGEQHWNLCKTCRDKINVTNHAFNSVVSDAYLKSTATCTLEAVYYQSCVCGATDSATFTNGAVLGHNTEAGIKSTDASYHYLYCSRCSTNVAFEHYGGTATCITLAACSECGTEYGTYAAHQYSAATCLTPATCSVCGGTSGAALGHTTEWAFDNNYHWELCTRCGTTGEAIKHSGGTATCVSGPACSTCDHEYETPLGHVWSTTCAPCEDASNHYYVCTRSGCTEILTSPHAYTNKIIEEKYLKSPATCTLPAYYYFACDCGATGSATFTTGSALGHQYKYTSNTTTSYAYNCSVCGCLATAELKIDSSDGTVSGDGINEYVFSGSEIKKAQFVGDAEWNSANLSTPAITYTPQCVSVGAVTASVILDGHELSVNYRIIKADQHPEFKPADWNYVYEQVDIPAAQVNNLEENPVVKYYYKNIYGSGDYIELNLTTTKVLTPATYYLYAVIEPTYDYNGTQTALTSFQFTVDKAQQILICSDVSIAFETIGMKPIVSGVRTNGGKVTYRIKPGSDTDVITIDPNTGLIRTLRGGNTIVQIDAIEDAFFHSATKYVNVEVTSRALNVSGIEMDPNTFYFGQEVVFEGIPSAATRTVEKAVPGWRYIYSGTMSTGGVGEPYNRSEVAPTLPGVYTLSIEVLDDNAKYSGTQTIEFTILPATPTLTAIQSTPITYGALLTDSAVSGVALNPYTGEVVPGTWYFTYGDTTTPHAYNCDTELYEVTFVPDDLVRYTTSTALIHIKVNKQIPIIMTCACLSYTYAAVVSIPTISAFQDESKLANVSYYYSDAMIDETNPGKKWENISNTSLDAGKYYMVAVIDGYDYLLTTTEAIVFDVYKGTQVLNENPVASGSSVTIGQTDRGRDLEYCIGDSNEWLSVPTLDKDGSFVVAGLGSGTHTIHVRVKESNNYLASPSKFCDLTPDTISVAYSANGASGSVEPSYASGGQITIASPDGLTYKGYHFVAWNTMADGSGTNVNPGEVTDSACMLYAKWEANTYTVAFDANGADGEMTSQEFTYDSPAALNASTFTGNTTTGTIFAGWALNPKGPVYYSSGASIMNLAAEGVVTLYAIWTNEEAGSVQITVSADTEGSVRLTLRKGNLILDQTEFENLDGNLKHDYSLNNIPDGVYDLVAELSTAALKKTMTKILIVKDGVVSESVEFKDSKANSLLELADGTRQVVVGNLDKEAESKREEGKEITITMNIKAVEELQLAANALASEKAIQDGIKEIRKVARTAELEFLNIDVFEKISVAAVETEYQRHNTHNVIELVIPFDTTGKHSVQVYRAHDAKGYELSLLGSKPQESAYRDGTFYVDWTNGIIYLYAQRFSVYALGWNAPEPVYYGGGGGKKLDKECPRDNTCPIDPYTDTLNDYWWHDGVHFCIENGIMIGRGVNLFVPEGNVKRAEIATMLWRIAGSPKVDYELKFTDIEEDAYYIDALRWANANGVFLGYSEELFGPMDDITREQLAAVYYRFATKYYGAKAPSKAELPFPDAADIDDYAVEAMTWCYQNGIILGRNMDGTGETASPLETSWRAEAACITQRFCESFVKEYMKK